MRSQRPAEPPRLLRSVVVQAAVLCAVAILAGRPWASRETRAEPPRPEPPKEERRIRVIRVPRPEPMRVEVPPPKPSPPVAQKPPPKDPPLPRKNPPLPQKLPPPRVVQRPFPPLPKALPEPPAPARPPEQPLAHIAADVKAVKGVPLRVRVPSSPAELAAHLRNSGGCMVISRLASDGGADIVRVFGEDGWRTVDTPEPPCSGVPRRVIDPQLNLALGDPIGRARAEYGPGDYGVEVILSPTLHDRAESALVARFGPISQEEMAEKAAESGYQLTCDAEPAGAVRCQ